MKILYDYQIFFMQKYGGISRYYYELAGSPQSEYFPYTAVKYHQNIYLEKTVASEPSPKHPLSCLVDKPYIGRRFLMPFFERMIPRKDPVLENQKFVAEKIVSFAPDIFHPTFYNDYFLDFIGDIPFVLTIYDMIYELFPEYFPGDRTSAVKRKLFDRAKKVIAISHNTKNDIMELYDDPGDKVRVVHLSSSYASPDASVTAIDSLPEKYLLYVGDRSSYKNFKFFVFSLSDLLRRDPGLHLICTGRPFYLSESSFFRDLGIHGKIQHRFADDESMPGLYANARAFVYPTLYEGFGIPVLEAFSCGCPAAVSRAGSLPEIGGDAAVYFEPKSKSDICATVEPLVYDETRRAELIGKGRIRAQKYSWEKAVREMAEVYRSCL